ncbi:MAG: GMP synthase [Pseudomonadota bacterium]
MTQATLNIGLLLCDDVDPEFRSTYGTYAQFFRESLHRVDKNIVLTPFRCVEDDFPADVSDFEGYLISGSRHGVYDGYPWIDRLSEFVRTCYARQIKTVGICFGHQLIAQALGGVAEKADVGWGFGIHRSFMTKSPDWDGEEQDSGFNLVVIHQDQVTALPPGFETFAHSDFCPHGVISDNKLALGIQGHPEFSKEFCAFRAKYRRELIGEEVYEKTLQSLEEMPLNADRALGWITAFFRRDVKTTTS